jgi:hypothetical protein
VKPVQDEGVADLLGDDLQIRFHRVTVQSSYAIISRCSQHRPM